MRVIGTIPAYNEAGDIGDAVRSLFEVGCDQVFVLDGAWLAADGRPFLDGGGQSTDGTAEEARAAGASYREWAPRGGDGAKRTALVHMCGAREGDRILLLDADERATGSLPDVLPRRHACVILRNEGENDLPGFRSDWPLGDGGPHPVPLMRLLAYHPTLECTGPGHWYERGRKIQTYAFATVERPLDPEQASALPILEGLEIVHLCGRRDPDRVAAKVAYYEARREALQAGVAY